MENIVEKKKYQAPMMEVVEMRSPTNLLESSADALGQDSIGVYIEDED